MKLDRELQRKILEELADSYPDSIFPSCLVDYFKMSRGSYIDHKARANIIYLVELGLIEVKLISVEKIIENVSLSQGWKATAKGMDFLADDGGLSAILGTVTVKLHEDTLRTLIENKITESHDLAPQDKRVLIDQLRSLPGESIKHLTMKLLDKGLENLPAAIGIIQTAIGFPGT